MRIYLIRHADPDYERNTVTPRGHLEAKALAERLGREGLDRIFCSPLGRARQTMQYTADLLGMAHEIEEWTQEIDGLWLPETPWGPMASWDMPGEEVHAHKLWIGSNENKEHFSGNIPVAEKYSELQQASDAFFARLGYRRAAEKYLVLEPNRQKIAVFCHGGFGLTWLAHLLNIPLGLVWAGFWLAPSSVTTILFEERSAEWAVPRCIGLGDVSHLYQAGLEVSPRGIMANFQ